MSELNCYNTGLKDVLIPLNSGQLLCQSPKVTLSNRLSLNPFEFRAVTLSLKGFADGVFHGVLIPLNSGQLLCPKKGIMYTVETVLIPLNSGQLLCR